MNVRIANCCFFGNVYPLFSAWHTLFVRKNELDNTIQYTDTSNGTLNDTNIGESEANHVDPVVTIAKSVS